ncbi:hypothetical protein B9Z19DRAFT_1049650 [Tuber borchii]|uniref:Rhodopsin domain-containing protein n=1 Tax=Tuber borchii TaxID=42251 RepID=A0A2T6ZQR7_TUBBO|nr:hypothetical protein B9Z19DRAFT_1049650 [Tuber borchii]
MGSTLGPLFLGVMYALLGLSTLFVVLRFYCRLYIVKMIRSDDWIMLVALVSAWGLGVTNNFHIKYGIGKHTVDNAKDYKKIIVPILTLWYVYQLQYLITLFLIKASILSFYRRISRERSYQISVWIVGGIIVAYTVAMLIVNLFECPRDITRAWSPGFPTGCNDLSIVYYAMASFNIISDIVILFLPFPMLLRLQTKKRNRVALLLIFSCGSIAVIASIVRINALYQNKKALDRGGDTSYLATYVLLWSQIEVNVAIITACAPAMKPFVSSVLQSARSTKPSYAQDGLGYTGSAAQGGGRVMPLRSLGIRETRGPVGNTTTIGGGLNESQEDMVFKGDGIVRTVEVKVDMEVDGRSEDSIRQLEFGR